MPHYGTLENEENLFEVKINVNGWVNPIYIQYVFKEINGQIYTYWCIKGTNHIFTILTDQINKSYLSYNDHFKDALIIFRNDYISWKEQKFQYSWQKEYEKIFRKFII